MVAYAGLEASTEIAVGLYETNTRVVGVLDVIGIGIEADHVNSIIEAAVLVDDVARVYAIQKIAIITKADLNTMKTPVQSIVSSGGRPCINTWILSDGFPLELAHRSSIWAQQRSKTTCWRPLK